MKNRKTKEKQDSLKKNRKESNSERKRREQKWIHETPPNIYIYITEKLSIIAIIFLSLVSFISSTNLKQLTFMVCVILIFKHNQSPYLKEC